MVEIQPRDGSVIDRVLRCNYYQAIHVQATNRQSWFRAVLLVGAVYAIVGITFGLPASHARAWRLAAWVVSGVAYAIHVSYERCWLRNSSLTAALHVALAAALGAL